MRRNDYCRGWGMGGGHSMGDENGVAECLEADGSVQDGAQL